MSYHWLDVDNQVARPIRYHKKFFECITCHGKGTVYLNPDLDDDREIECPDCNGDREIETEVAE